MRKTLIELCFSVHSTVCRGRDGRGPSRELVFWPEVSFTGGVTKVVMTNWNAGNKFSGEEIKT